VPELRCKVPGGTAYSWNLLPDTPCTWQSLAQMASTTHTQTYYVHTIDVHSCSAANRVHGNEVGPLEAPYDPHGWMGIPFSYKRAEAGSTSYTTHHSSKLCTIPGLRTWDPLVASGAGAAQYYGTMALWHYDH
jgi:hypothetical protein